MAKYVKFVFLYLLLVPALGLLLFGPTQTAGTAPAPAGFTVVNYWEKWTGDEASQMQVIVEDFNRTVGREKKIFVRYLSMSSIDQKTLVATAAGVPPDVAGLWQREVTQFASLDALTPLDDLAARRGITESVYKPVFWKGCNFRGKLWGLISTPAAAALHYNKTLLYENADKLRRAGLDPLRAPGTIDELDRYAHALDTWVTPPGGKPRIDRSGYLPTEPGWYLNFTAYWFGGELFDPAAQKLTLTRPENVRAYEWVEGYSKTLGLGAMGEFRGGLSTQFDTPQNPFVIKKLAMVLQGPWMANFIYNRARPMSERLVPWTLERYLPRVLRPYNYEWGVAPFPSAAPGAKDVTLADFDVLVIPRGARHPAEAFEFLAYVNRQDVMEKLCSMHCKGSPLAKVSDEFIRNHPNPYIDVFERLSASPNAHSLPPMAIWPEVDDELTVVGQAVASLDQTPAKALEAAQQRTQERHDHYLATEAARAASR